MMYSADQVMAMFSRLEGQGGVGQTGSPMGYGYGSGMGYNPNVLPPPWGMSGGMGMFQQPQMGAMGGANFGFTSMPDVGSYGIRSRQAATAQAIGQLAEKDRPAAFAQLLASNENSGISADQATALLNKQTDIAGAMNGIGLLASIGCTIGNMWIQHDATTKMARLQQNHMDNVQELNLKYMTTQVDIANIGMQVQEGRNDLMRDLAYIQADLEKAKAKIISKTSIANTKTVARYGFLNGQFYGTTQRSTNRYTG